MMIKFLIYRIFRAIPLLFVVIGIVFLLYQYLPGDPVEATYVMPQRKYGMDSVDYNLQYQRYAKELGLDLPLFFIGHNPQNGLQWNGFNNQYATKVKKIFQGDFGISYRTKQPVLKELSEAIRWTLLINGFSLVLIFFLGIYLGMESASRYRSKIDRIILNSSFVLDAIPTFWLATLLMIFFTNNYYGLQIFPSTGLGNAPYDAGFSTKLLYALPHLLLPVICIVLGSVSMVIRQMRSSALQVAKQDYIRTARAKGLNEKRIMRRHIFPNAVFPMITMAGTAVPDLIAGSFLVENIFNIPGMGKLTVESIANKDFPILFAVVILTAVFTILGNTIAELLYRHYDPKVG
ncbi:MAG: ABC transporter permease [Saprospiraceae bacterium]